MVVEVVTEVIQQSPAAPLLGMMGAGAVTVTTILTAWSHSGKVRSEAAFASLAGVNPYQLQSVTRSGTGSTGVVIGASTEHCTPLLPEWFMIPGPGTTSPNVPKKAIVIGRSVGP